MGSIGYFYDDYQRQFVFKYKDIKDLQLAFHEVQFERWKKGGAPGAFAIRKRQSICLSTLM